MQRSWQEVGHGEAGVSWLLEGEQPRLNVVLVHGFVGDHLETFTYLPPKRWRVMGPRVGEPVFLVDLLKALDQPYNFFSVGHRAGISRSEGIQQAGDKLVSFVQTVVPELEGRNEAAPLVFVAHSFGGLASRRAILDLVAQRDRYPVAGVLLMGTPNRGAQVALAAAQLGSRAGTDMKPYNQILSDLNREWSERMVNGGNPGVAPDTRAPILGRNVVGSRDAVVPPESAVAMAVFGDVLTLDKDHLGLVKPAGPNDLSLLAIADFLEEAETWSVQLPVETATKDLTYRLRKASLGRRWVRREKEFITLTKTESPTRLGCHLEQVREGGIARREFTICLFVSNLRPEGEYDFNWELGQGALSNDDFVRLNAGFSGAGSDFDSFFKVETLEVRQGGKVLDYRPIEHDSRSGSRIVTYDCGEELVEGQPYEQLRLAFTTVTDRRHEWFLYTNPRTVTEGLEVVLTAPFRALPVPFGLKAEPAQAVPGGFAHRCTSSRATPLYCGVVWQYTPAAEVEQAAD